MDRKNIMIQYEKKMEKVVSKKLELDYYLHLPDGYENEPDRKWPMLVYLHGGGACKDETRSGLLPVLPTFIVKAITENNYPFILISPQCPSLSWTLYFEELYALITDVMGDYNADSSRIYLTGLSLGGYGTWDFAIRYPDLLAAIAPLCASCSYWWETAKIRHLPVWIFHGALDNSVPINDAVRMVNYMKDTGAEEVKMTVYGELYHHIWETVYADPALYEWFLQHQKAELG